MIKRIVALIFVLGFMLIIVYTNIADNDKIYSPTLILGFMLLAAYLVGFFFEKFGLPRITGYIIAGLLFGPYFLEFYTKEDVLSLNFLNNLALAFIAFCAGAELRYENLKKKVKIHYIFNFRSKPYCF